MNKLNSVSEANECFYCVRTLTQGYFCSRSCKNSALIDGIIKPKDIDYEISNLKLKYVDEIEIEIPPNKRLNINQLANNCSHCVSALNEGYFCSRSCRDTALTLGYIKIKDIDYEESNIKIKNIILEY